MWKAYARILIAGLSLSCNGLPALANFDFNQATSGTITHMFSFDSGTTPAGTANCAAANTECAASIPINTAGSPLFVTGNAGLVTGTGGTFPVTGSVTANAGTNLNTSLLALEGGGNLATLAAAITGSRMQVNLSQVNGNTPVTGNGVTGTGSQRVTIASDNTAFSVNATLQASSATAIGTVNPTTAANWGIAATGAAVPANTNYIGINNGGTLTGWTGAVTNAGTFAVQLSGATNNINNISGTVSLPTGAATAALQTTINSTLGTPFQAGGSIGNTGFTALQAGTANIAGNPFFVSPGTGASFTVAQGTASNLNMTCANCSGSGASGTDEGGFTAGSSVFAPGGGFFQTTATSNALSSGQWGAWQMTANRAGFVNLRNAAGTELGTSGAPLRIDPTGTTAQPVSQASAGNLNATVVGTGTFAVQSAPSSAATWGIGATAAAVPANALYLGVNVGGNLVGMAPGTSGTPSTQVSTVQGAVSMTPLLVNPGTAANFGVGATGSAVPANASYLAINSGGNLTGWTGAVTNAGTFAVQATLQAGSALAGKFGIDQTTVGTTNGVSLAQVGTTTIAAGNGVSGAGVQRVAIASDNTAFAVNATLQATATTAIGKVDPNTIANWGLVASTQNSATPTNAQLGACQFNTTPTTITSGNVSPCQTDNAGNILVNIKAGSSTGAVAQGSTTSGQTGGLIQAAATTSAPTYTTATTNPLSMDVNGNLRVVGTGIAVGSTTSGQTGSLIFGATTTAAPNYTTTQSNPLSLDTNGGLRVNCATGCSAGPADEATFTAGTSTFGPSGGFFQTTATNNALTTGQQGMAQMTAQRAFFVNLRDASGTQLAGTAGTAATPVLSVQGITSMTPLAVSQSGTWNITNISGTVSLPTGAATSALQATATDAATFTAGSSIFAPLGGQFTSGGATACVTGHQCIAGMTAARAMFSDLSSIAGAVTSTGNGTVGSGVLRVAIASDNTAFSVNSSSNTAQVNGVTVLTGTGATGTGAQRVTVSTDQATNAGAALVKGGVGVVNGGNFFQAVAASQTATTLQQTTGAAGDYLSHCDIYPTSTSPGVVTVFDNTNTAANSVVLFAGGATSLSNLAPIPVPVGAVSVSGAWKVTTGTGVSVVCYGRFS